MSERKRWMSDVPEKDNFGDPITGVLIDGKTTMGPWALMTDASFRRYGVGLGTGKGQKYVREEDGIYYKVDG